MRAEGILQIIPTPRERLLLEGGRVVEVWGFAGEVGGGFFSDLAVDWTELGGGGLAADLACDSAGVVR